MFNLVEMVAGDDEQSFNQKCKYGNLVDGHAENANAMAFAMEIKELTGKTVFVAKPGLEVGINKC